MSEILLSNLGGLSFFLYRPLRRFFRGPAQRGVGQRHQDLRGDRGQAELVAQAANVTDP